MGKFITVALAILILALGGVYILSAASPLPASILPQYRPDVKNGETLFYIAGCGSCHAAPKGDKCDDPRAADHDNPGATDNNNDDPAPPVFRR